MSITSSPRTQAPDAPPTRRDAAVGRRRRGDARIWLYVLPVSAVFLFVFIGPLFYTAWTALHETRYYQIGEFSGLNSFVELFTDPDDLFAVSLARVA